MMMLKAIATSAAASPMMNRTKIWPTVGSGAVKRFKAMKFSAAEEKMSSPAMSMPIRVRRRMKPKMPAASRKAARIR